MNTTIENNAELSSLVEKVDGNGRDNDSINAGKVFQENNTATNNNDSNRSHESNHEYMNSLSLEEENKYLRNELNRMRHELKKYKSTNQERHHDEQMRKQKQKNQIPSSWTSKLSSSVSSLLPSSFFSSTTKHSPVSLKQSKKLIENSDEESDIFVDDIDVDAEYGETVNSINNSDYVEHNTDSSGDENSFGDNIDDINELRTTISNSTTYEELDDMTFVSSFYDRTKWLVGLLVLQSMSSFIIAHNETLLQHHTVIVQFLTMLVGAGGNAGNQAAVRVIRGLAVGNLSNYNLKSYMKKEMCTALLICITLGVAGCVRAAAFQIPLKETLAITSSLVMIVMSSIVIGTALPLIMKAVKIDPAHSSTTIQVLMDILGVTVTVFMCKLILES